MLRPAAIILLIAFSTPTLGWADDNVPPQGFVALFNGRDMTGWQGLVGNPVKRTKMSNEELATAQMEADKQAFAHWRVEDGTLVFDGKAKHSGLNLCTKKEYGNFELYVDWKITPLADSGIYLRGSPQIQIWDPDNERERKNGAHKGSGAMWNNQKHERFPIVKADKPAGEWNTFYIKMVGEKITVKLNNQLVVDNVVYENYWERDKPIYARGPIELQDHGNELWFKNIFLRELP